MHICMTSMVTQQLGSYLKGKYSAALLYHAAKQIGPDRVGKPVAETQRRFVQRLELQSSFQSTQCVRLDC